jgi:hypothetical protein
VDYSQKYHRYRRAGTDRSLNPGYFKKDREDFEDRELCSRHLRVIEIFFISLFLCKPSHTCSIQRVNEHLKGIDKNVAPKEDGTEFQRFHVD